VQRHTKTNLVSRRKKMYFVECCEIKNGWRKKKYIHCRNMKESIRRAWFRVRIWKLMKWVGEWKVIYVPYLEGNRIIHIILQCMERQSLREIGLNCKGLNINEDIRFKKVTNCTKTTKLRNLEKLLWVRKPNEENSSKVWGRKRSTVQGGDGFKKNTHTVYDTERLKVRNTYSKKKWCEQYRSPVRWICIWDSTNKHFYYMKNISHPSYVFILSMPS
jgi:hypothetical protein